jgi:hypothetical protein
MKNNLSWRNAQSLRIAIFAFALLSTVEIARGQQATVIEQKRLPPVELYVPMSARAMESLCGRKLHPARRVLPDILHRFGRPEREGAFRMGRWRWRIPEAPCV